MGGVWVQDYCRQSHFRNLRVSSEAARFVRDLYFQKLSGFVLISDTPTEMGTATPSWTRCWLPRVLQCRPKLARSLLCDPI